MEHKIPIKLGARRINQGSEFVDSPPVIEVMVSAEKNWSISTNRHPENNGKFYTAMIDTGSETTMISKELAKEINAEKISEAVAHGFDGTKKVQVTKVHVIIHPQNIIYSSYPGISDLASQGDKFDLVLGRSFLEHCRLEVHGPNNLYNLWWVG